MIYSDKIEIDALDRSLLASIIPDRIVVEGQGLALFKLMELYKMKSNELNEPVGLLDML
jgi:hypothetical protein